MGGIWLLGAVGLFSALSLTGSTVVFPEHLSLSRGMDPPGPGHIPLSREWIFSDNQSTR